MRVLHHFFSHYYWPRGILTHHLFHYTEDPAGPPMIALPCGHLVCQLDFQKLGGYLGDKPSDQPNNDRPRRSSSFAERERNFISGLDMMRMIGMSPFGFPDVFGEDDDDDDDDDEDDDYVDTDDDDDDSCPPLERVGRNNNDDAGEETDDSMPPLEPVRRAGNDAVEEHSDDDSMPPLQRRDGQVASEDEEPVEEEEEANDDDSMPPLMPRAVESDDEEEDDDDMPPLMIPARGGNVAARGDGAAVGDEGPPDLVVGAGSDSDDEDVDCPALQSLRVDDSSDEEHSNVAAVDDNASIPALTHRGAESDSEEEKEEEPPALGSQVGQESDDESAVSEVDEDDDISEVDEEEEVIPFPVLDRVRGAMRAPTSFTREEYLALPEAQRNFGSGGAWIMIPSGYNEDFSTLVYTNQDKCVHMGVFACESRLIVNNNESVLICAPRSDSSQSDVWYVSLEMSEQKYEVPTNAQCVSDGDGGVWALTPTGGTKELSYYNAVGCPTGSVVHMLPESSYLIMDFMGGVWAHVKKKGTIEVEPGLYFYALGAGHSLISWIDQDAKCTTGADGVCVITSAGDQAQLINIVLGETPRTVTLKNCAASKDIRVVPREKEEGDRALYVHCRLQNRWKLCLLNESGRLSDICDCPKDARVVGDGKGGAWILKRTGASHQMRMLVFVTPSGATRDHGLSFPPGSKIAGL